MSKKHNIKTLKINLYGASKNITIYKGIDENDLEIGLELENIEYNPLPTINNINAEFNKTGKIADINNTLRNEYTSIYPYTDLNLEDDNKEKIPMYKWALDGDNVGFPYYEAFTYKLEDNMFLIELSDLNINVSETPETFIPIFLEKIGD